MRVAVALGVFFLLITLAGIAARPGKSGESTTYSPEEIQAVREDRSFDFDPKNPLRLHVDVDYSIGQNAPWFPKGQSPLLADLVKQGKLPPLAERIGPEPCVMRGVDGIGKYGGTWVRLASSSGDVAVVTSRLSYPNLLRWSPHGYPIVPHLAKSYSVSPDSREFTFTLRKGLKWSDGQPFTADDIIYWWKYECKDKALRSDVPPLMKIRGKSGNVEKLGPYCIKITFPEPNGLFPARLATCDGIEMVNCPAHYLRQYHPSIGNKAKIDQYIKARKLGSPISGYRDVKNYQNPEHPRLWPWVYRTYKSNPPQTFVRNPYYWVVDTEGNQLPYVDRLLFEVKSTDMIVISAANGEATMQGRHISYYQYSLLMSQRKKNNYDVYHWYSGGRGSYVISPNLNRRIDPNRPDTKHKHELLNDKRFRQSLSLAINRKAIIDAEYNGQTIPAQTAPGPASSFYEPSLYKSFVEYDPDRANRLLDEIGLTRRDREGYRTFKDGSRMVFMLNYCGMASSPGIGQFVVDDWAKVGIRTILRGRARALFYVEKAALQHDFSVWGGNGEFLPILSPRYFVPCGDESNYAIGYGRWYVRGGLYGNELAAAKYGCIEPPADHPIRKAMEIYERVSAESSPDRQREIFQEVLKIAARNIWSISICTSPPSLFVVKKGFRNVPRKLVSSWDFLTPGNGGIETYYFENPYDSPGAIAQMKQEIIEPTLPDNISSAKQTSKFSGKKLATIIRWAFLAIGVLLAVLISVKHPYIGRRLLIMVPTLLIISLIAFTVIQLPPGNFVTSKIMRLQESGDAADLQQIEELKDTFRLEDSWSSRYAHWLGLTWFTSFDAKDEGLLQGNMGRSMENNKPVNDIVGDRILLTVLISMGTILFTWAIAIPIGIYSAVKQYSVGDYLFTFFGFIGMCIPSFLLALLLMYVSAEWFGIKVSGLFSSRYGAQPEWTWPKVVDLLGHIWVPVLVLGVGGTAGMIRIMRANLLDELNKPYVTTARAKGVRPLKLLMKYPVRMALNPFISGIGGLFPQLVSGGAIVAMVLSLPTVGPLMLDALMNEDMYLAGSMLMVLSLLGVLGTLVSDLLLLWLDPRIRFQGGSR
ncbi:MAG: ABC transporter permease subunit [Phycisphaerae bacterium]|nr:ABC transporter permease subunit [Phycisphaerae bacterium]